jgi:hypothetical protein
MAVVNAGDRAQDDMILFDWFLSAIIVISVEDSKSASIRMEAPERKCGLFS